MKDLIARVEHQARVCAELGSPMYAQLLSRTAADIEAGGPCADLLAPVASAPVGAVMSLRMLAGVHALVLRRLAPELALFYPTVGGLANDEAALWSAFRAAIAAHAAPLTSWLSRPPQTNEVGRAAPLLGALGVAAERTNSLPIRLFELGASAGLNLRVDHLPIGPGSTINTPMPARSGKIRVVERVGVDPHPVDPLSQEGRLQLSAYVWADQLDRFARLSAGLEAASKVPAVVVTGEAGEFVGRLALHEQHLTVLWHSVMWQYLDEHERTRVLGERDRLAAQATEQAPFAHISFEPLTSHELDFEVVLRLWPGGDSVLLGFARPHGVPVQWFAEGNGQLLDNQSDAS